MHSYWVQIKSSIGLVVPGSPRYIGIHMCEQKICEKVSFFAVERLKQGKRLWVWNVIFQEKGDGFCQNLLKFFRLKPF